METLLHMALLDPQVGPAAWLSWQSVGLQKAGERIEVELRYANGPPVSFGASLARVGLVVGERLAARGGPGTLPLTAAFTLTRATSYCIEWALLQTGEAGAAVGRLLLDAWRDRLPKLISLGRSSADAVAGALRRAFAAGQAAGMRVTVAAREAGVWRADVTRRASGAAVQAARTVKVAAARAVFSRAGRRRAKVTLTKAGARLLRHRHRLRAQVTVSFQPNGADRLVLGRRRVTLGR